MPQKVVTLTYPEEAPIEVVNALERPAAARQEINLEKRSLRAWMRNGRRR